MAKHVKKAHEESAVKTLGLTPEKMINLAVAGKENRDWAAEVILNEGPPHKQLYSALLLTRLQVMVKAVEKNSGNRFALQDGITLASLKEEVEIPVDLPAAVAKKSTIEELAEAVSHAPAHEILAFNIMLQAIEWSIKTLKANAGQDE